MIKLCYINILEDSSVSLSTGSESTAYPLYRIYDRALGRIFQGTKSTVSSAIEIRIDQGTTIQAVNRILIPTGHNLNGLVLTVQYSSDNSSWVNASSWTQADTALINTTWASQSKRYWKINIANPATVTEFSELFLTQTYEWELDPLMEHGPFDDEFNVERDMTEEGQVRFLVHGDPKRQRKYQITCETTQKDNILIFNDEWAGSRPFWLFDHSSVWIYGELRSPLGLRQTDAGIFAFDFDFVEILP